MAARCDETFHETVLTVRLRRTWTLSVRERETQKVEMSSENCHFGRRCHVPCRGTIYADIPDEEAERVLLKNMTHVDDRSAEPFKILLLCT